MGSNRKLIFGAVLVVAGLVFWGLMTALGNLSGKNAANRVASGNGVAQTVSLPASGRMIAYAKSDIPQGTLVTKDMVEMRALPGDAPTTTYITDPASQAIGFVTGAPISKGHPIQPRSDFVGHISQVGIAGMLQPGKRAIVIPFANKPTLHDLVAIGDHVDINSAFDGQEARTIVPDVRVLAVDVFGSDFPQTNIARRGAYKADAQLDAPGSMSGSAPAPAGQAPGAPGAAPTPTPTAAPSAARPDPAITLEVTPDQANRILLAQASGGVLDFVVLPTRSASMVGGTSGTDALGLPIGQEMGGIGGLTAISVVTRPQLAPFAESKKSSGGASTRANSGSNGERTTRSADRTFAQPTRPSRFTNVALPPFGPITTNSNPGLNGPEVAPANPNTGVAPSPVTPPTYNIPIYADGRTVRVETVPSPKE